MLRLRQVRIVGGSRNRLRCEGGGAVVELALVTPILAALLLGALDFGRVFHYALAVTGAAHAGAQWGSTSLANSQNFSQMKTIAESHAPGLGVTATATSICRCGSGTATPNPQACNSGCTGTLRVYASVTATRTFTTIVNYPGIPRTTAITRTAQLRAQ
jgi:Flp pilus assembly protein TadG